MGYLGNTPTTQSFTSGTDYFNGTGSQTAFTLTRSVNSVNDIQVTVNNVVQQPNSGYTISGTTLTFDQAPSSGTNNVYVRYLSTTTQTIAPSSGVALSAALGTASSPSYSFIGDSNTGIFSPAADTIAFAEGGTEVARIDSSGNVGIGTTSPSEKLHVAGSIASSGVFIPLNSTTAIGYIGNSNPITGGSATNVGLRAESAMLFATGGSTERMRIDSSGNVGINGIPTDTGFDTTDTRLYVVAPNSDFGAALTTISDSVGRNIRIANQAKTVQGILDANSTAVILGSNTSHPLLFNTVGTERMRVVSNGELGYLCTGLDGDRPNAVGTYKQTNGNTKVRVVSDGTAAFQFYSPTGGGSPVGSITPNASSTTYATSSDYRLKENIAPMAGALAKVAQLKPCTYTWKSNGSTGEGFIAHELQAVVPEAVIGEKDAVNEDGSIKPQGIDTSFLVATLTAAIQELNEKVEAQAAEIAALKGANNAS